MKKSHIKKISVSLVKAPLIQPFRIATGVHNTFENIFFRLELTDGTKGYGEAAIADHITGETVKRTLNNLKKIGESLEGRDAAQYLTVSGQLNEQLKDNKSAVAAIEMALMDALCRQWKIPLWKIFGGSTVRKLTSDITIVIADLIETEKSVKKFYKQGFRTFKIKVGMDMDLDYRRVLLVRKYAPKCRIYLDINQGFSANETLLFIRLLEKARIRPALLEQPVPKDDWHGLKKVSLATRIPVCADETASSLEDCIKIIRERAAPVINIKLMKFGLFHSREVAALAKANELQIMIGGMLESSLAMTASAHLAAGMGGMEYIDLDTPFFIKGDLRSNPYLNARGVYDLKKVKAGIGIIPKL